MVQISGNDKTIPTLSTNLNGDTFADGSSKSGKRGSIKGQKREKQIITKETTKIAALKAIVKLLLMFQL